MADGGGKGYGEYDRPHEDLREWIDRAESLGELMRVDGVDWNLEMGSVAEMIYHAKPDKPARRSCSRTSRASRPTTGCSRARPTR